MNFHLWKVVFYQIEYAVQDEVAGYYTSVMYFYTNMVNNKKQ